eukprot:Skav206876  [mRNA]  locus=scaffold898:152778:153888:- [translate_table: standard]
MTALVCERPPPVPRKDRDSEIQRQGERIRHSYGIEERRGKERKGKERKGEERRGKERKGEERRGERCRVH